MNSFMTPREIEEESLRIIEAEAGPHDHLTREQWHVVRRMIHATADFDFITTARFHPRALDCAAEAVRRKLPIYTDTEMLRAAIGTAARSAGIDVFSFVSDEEIIRESRDTGLTRSALGLRKAAPKLAGAIVAIGNAPTALHEAITLCGRGVLDPALIIGLPVGFVEARESKERLWSSGLVCITNQDRKGGTPATAAALNAIFKIMRLPALTESL